MTKKEYNIQHALGILTWEQRLKFYQKKYNYKYELNLKGTLLRYWELSITWKELQTLQLDGKHLIPDITKLIYTDTHVTYQKSIIADHAILCYKEAFYWIKAHLINTEYVK